MAEVGLLELGTFALSWSDLLPLLNASIKRADLPATLCTVSRNPPRHRSDATDNVQAPFTIHAAVRAVGRFRSR